MISSIPDIHVSRHSWLAALLLGILLSLACEFSPTQTNYHHVNEPEPFEVGLYLDVQNPLGYDTLYVWGTTTINFLIDTESHRIHRLDFYLDDVTISWRGELPNGNLTLHTPGWSDGPYLLKAVVYTESGSGSLADKLEAEGFIYEIHIPLRIHNAPPQSVSVTSATADDGSVLVQWQKSNDPRFIAYRLYHDPVHYAPRLIATIWDLNTTAYYDSSFVGGSRNYCMRVVIHEDSTAISQPYAYQATGTVLTETVLTDLHAASLTWTANSFTTNFAAYEIYRDDTLFQSLPDYTQTTWTDSLVPFGEEVFYRLEVRAVREVPGISAPSSTGSVMVAKELPFHHQIFYSAVADAYFTRTRSSDTITKIDAATNAISSTVNLRNMHKMTMSINGIHFYVSADDSMYRVDPVSLEVTSLFHTMDYTGVYNDVNYLTVSNDNHLVYYQHDGGLVVLDMNSEQLVTHLNEGIAPGMCFTPDSRYCYTGYIYELSDTFTRVDQQPWWFLFFLHDNQHYIHYFDNTVEKYYILMEITTGLEVRTMYPNSRLTPPDPTTGYCAVITPSGVEVHDILTETKISERKLPIRGDVSLLNGHLISDEGGIISIP